jgi:carbamate kinase
MRVVVALDGDLLVSQNGLGIPGQKQEIARVVDHLGVLLRASNELLVVHGNASQIGFVLLRSEMSSHIVHPVPLDVCGSDTQGATGYLLQQAMRNWLQQKEIGREVVSLITQVLVDVAEPAVAQPIRGIGPYYDPDKAQSYASSRNWNFVLVSGRGYRRSVPSLKPKRVIEARSIQSLLASGAVVICAGGGGIPVTFDENGQLLGVEAVIDKSATVKLLAKDMGACGIIFVTLSPSLDMLLRSWGSPLPIRITLDDIDEFLERYPELETDLGNKLSASRDYLSSGGDWVLLSPLSNLASEPGESDGLWITRERARPLPISDC